MKKLILILSVLFISTVAISVIFVLAIHEITNRYVYIKLDTSDFPLAQKWSSDLSENVLDLSVTEDSLFVFARTTNTLYEIDAATGKVLWHVPLTYQSVTYPAIAHNGIVYIADANKLLALNQKDGNVVWTRTLVEPRGKVESISGNSVFVNNTNDNIGSYDARTGLLAWVFPLYWYHPKFYISENRIYIPQNGLYIVDIATGKDEVKNGSDSIFDSEIYDDTIYYVTLENIVAFNAKTNVEAWRQKWEFSNNNFPRLDAYKQGIFFEGEESLSLLNKETGDLIWKAQVSHPMNPSIIGDMVFVMEGYNRTIRVFHITTGQEIGQLQTSSYHFLLAKEQQDMIAAGNMLIFSRGKELLCFISKE